MAARHPTWRARVAAMRPELPVVLLAATCYLPLLLTHRGEVGADTKTYLYLDPDRLLGRAWSMWDPNVGLGTVPHQNIGYLWPMGPWFWTFEHLGVPDWVAQRLWLGTILFLAGMGVRYLMRSLGQRGPGVAAAMFLYALSPYVLTLGARISALLLPFTALGWLLGLTIRAARERTWVHPALFALAVPTFGSTNATALLLVGLAPALWLPYATFALRELRLREAVGVAARIGVLTVGTSLWWIVGLWCQGSFGLDVLRYTETARTVADAASAPELLRGIGYWYFYGDDKLGAWIEPSVAYTQNPLLLVVTYAVPIVGLLAAGLVRWRHRPYFVGLIGVGLVVAVGAHPWGRGAPIGRGFEVFLQSQAGLAMRSLPRAVPLISLAFAVLIGVAVSALAEVRPRLERPAAVGLALLAAAALPPLWLGQMVGNNLQRAEEVPQHWLDAAAEIDARGQGEVGWTSRVMEVPGSDFASYRWGNTVDPITPGLTDRPYVSRELIPYGTPPSADLLNSFDRQLQEDVLDPDAVAPLARLMGVGDIVQRGDLAFERFNLIRPRQVYELLEEAPGLGPVTGFGGDAPNVPDPRLPLQDEVELGADPDLADPPQVGLFPVEGAPGIVVAKGVGDTVVLAGSGEGIIAAAAAGLIDGTELIRYSGSAFATDGGGADALRDAVADGAVLVVTDTNRRAGRRWGSVRETDGATETADSPDVTDDLSDNRLPLFEGAGSDSQTVAIHDGGIDVTDSGYGNAITYTPEDRAIGAFDDDLRTAWSTSAFADPRGEHIDVTYDEPRTTDRVRLVQTARGVQNRWITDVRLTFDEGPPVEVTLGPESRTHEGQWIDIGERTFREMSVEIVETDVSGRDSYENLSAVGFADIRLGDDDLRIDEAIRPPVDLLDALGAESLDHPLAIALTRRRSRPEAALRTDEEPTMVRDLELPTERSFALSGTVRLADAATDAVFDGVLGLPGADEGGIDVDSSRHLAGSHDARATAAIDGDPTSAWMPGFLGQDGEWASYEMAEPITFDEMDLQVVADGRHTVPTRIRIVADGETAAVVDLPPITDLAEPDAVVAVPIDLPTPVTGRRIEIHIDASRPVTTIDWLSTDPVVMPVGIAEWGIPGLQQARPEGSFDSGCRTDLVEIDGVAVPVRVTGSTAAAIEGDALDLATCDGEPVVLASGTSRLRTGAGIDLGLHVDTLTLRSAAGGDADPDTGVLVAPSPRPEVRVIAADRWRQTIEVGPRDQPTWLVVGQSHNAGWRATIDGDDLGEPQLVDGYSSGFLLPPGDGTVVVEVEWAPQKVVFVGLFASLAAALLALLLALRPWRWGRPVAAAPPAVASQRPLGPSRAAALASGGTAPSWLVTVAAAAGGAVAGAGAVNPATGLVLAVVTVGTLRVARLRPLLTLGPALLLALSGAYVILQQVRHRFSPGFEWPERFGRVHGVAYLAVLLLVLGVVVDRLRTGTWDGRAGGAPPTRPPGAPTPPTERGRRADVCPQPRIVSADVADEGEHLVPPGSEGGRDITSRKPARVPDGNAGTDLALLVAVCTLGAVVSIPLGIVDRLLTVDSPVDLDGVVALAVLVPVASTIYAMRRYRDAMRVRQELARISLRDALTGLPNRIYLNDWLEQELKASRRGDQRIAVLFIDLDRFKLINDTHGHEVGDALLVGLAVRLRECTEDDADRVIRYAGDQFVVICHDDPLRPTATVRLARRILSALEEPFLVGDESLRIAASIGVAVSTGQESAEVLIRHADAAMYDAKTHDDARPVVFDESVHGSRFSPATLEPHLRKAADEDDFRLVYQPVVETATGRMVGVEALLRWEHPERGAVRPSEFVPVLEESGLIVPVGAWILEQALQQSHAWAVAHPHAETLRVAINVSARQLAQAGFEDRVRSALRRFPVPPGSVCLEITEGALMVDIEAAWSSLRLLKRMGVKLALDDFGTGYSSLSYIRRFSLDMLKIDRSFVTGLGTSDEDTAIVEHVIGMAKALGMVTVGEGVETPLQLAELHRLGCELAQGYLLSPPVAAQEISAMLDRGASLARSLEPGGRGPDGPRSTDRGATRPFSALDLPTDPEAVGAV